MNCFVGIDLGTSSLKTIIMEENGKVRAVASRGYQFQSPHNNYAEHDPEEWWDACVDTIKRAMAAGNVEREEIRAVSFSGQMHGLVTLDQDCKPIRPAILHCDARSGRQIRKIRETIGEKKVRELIMNPVYT